MEKDLYIPEAEEILMMEDKILEYKMILGRGKRVKKIVTECTKILLKKLLQQMGFTTSEQKTGISMFVKR
jgi:hypothetical protein